MEFARWYGESVQLGAQLLRAALSRGDIAALHAYTDWLQESGDAFGSLLAQTVMGRSPKRSAAKQYMTQGSYRIEGSPHAVIARKSAMVGPSVGRRGHTVQYVLINGRAFHINLKKYWEEMPKHQGVALWGMLLQVLNYTEGIIREVLEGKRTELHDAIDVMELPEEVQRKFLLWIAMRGVRDGLN